VVNSRAPVRTFKTSEAAAALNVSPNTLRAWERRFAYPKPQRTAGQHRLYTDRDIFALRDALQQGLSISSAVARAREAVSEDTTVLGGALAAFDVERADAAMEAALALRSVERAIEEVLLSSLGDVADRHGSDSAPWAFAARWATDWLSRAQRLAPPPSRSAGVLIGDATRDDLDPDAIALRALQLFTGRGGARVLALPVSGIAGLGDVLNAFGPTAVVLAGGSAGDDDVARWAYGVRSAAGPLPVAIFRRGDLGDGGRTATRVLPSSPTEAHEELLAMIEHRSVHPPTRLLDEDDLAELLARAERRHGVGA